MLQLFQISVCDEPKCSKFSFEEHLLEKMVRMEFEVEKFSKSLKEKYNEIDELKNAVKAELRQLQNERDSWKAEMETLKTESIEAIKKQTDFSLVYTRWDERSARVTLISYTTDMPLVVITHTVVESLIPSVYHETHSGAMNTQGNLDHTFMVQNMKLEQAGQPQFLGRMSTIKTFPA